MEFRGQNLVCFVIAYNFNGKYAPEAGKTRMRTAFFTRETQCIKTTHSRALATIAHNHLSTSKKQLTKETHVVSETGLAKININFAFTENKLG